MRTLQIRWRLLVLIAILLIPSVGHAQTKEPEKPAQTVREQAIPLAIICAAGFERWMSNVDYLFGTIEREELSDYVGGKLANVNDLKGFDKDKPFGMLIFLRPGLLPQPYPVMFAPVKNLSDVIGTLTGGPVKVKKLDDTHYDLVGDRETYHARLAGEYAWIATQADQLDYEFPDPLTVTKRLADRYDIAIEFNLTQVPEGMKHIFLDFLRASTETAIQQRDGEPETAYRMRRLNALDTLDWLDKLLLQGERLTFGLKVDPKSKYATIELDVQAKQDSAFAKALQDVAARPSYFSNVVEDDVPLTFSMSVMMTPQNQQRFAEFFEHAEQDVAEQLANVLEGKKPNEAKKPENAAPPPADAPKSTGLPKSKRGSSGKVQKAKVPVPPALHDVFESLRATAKTGHVDFFVQFIADSKSDGAPQFTLIGGGKIADGTKFAGGATEILRQLKDRPGMARMDFGIDSHAGVTFHRIAGGGLDTDPGAQETFGAKPAVYVGLGSQAVWFALGQPDALAQLKLVIDRVNTEPVSRPDRRDFIPFQFHMHMKKWIELGEANSEQRLQRMEKAITEQQAKAKAADEEAKAAAAKAGANSTEPAPKPAEGNAQQRGPGRGGPGRGGPQGFGQQTAEQRREGLATWNSMQKKAFSGNDDKVRIDFKPTDQGARIRLQFDESFMRLMGLGVSRAMDSNIEAERKAAEKQQEKAKPKK